jgi:hypothetical protein
VPVVSALKNGNGVIDDATLFDIISKVGIDHVLAVATAVEQVHHN